MKRDIVVDHDAPLFETKLDASKKMVELSDADLRMVAGGATCGIGPVCGLSD